MEFERESRYYVLKRKDVEKYLSYTEQQILNLLANKCAMERMKEHKPILKCVCIEKDWPEYEIAWNMIQQRMETTHTYTVT